MFQVDKDIKLEPNLGWRPRKYPFYTMDIGESVFLPWKKITSMGSILTNVKDKKFTRRTRDECDSNGNLVKGIRVWRVS